LQDASAPLPKFELARERDVLTSAVREAGALALASFRSPLRQWVKGKSSPVCEADIAVDQLLRQRLGSAFPAHGWLSEETEDDPRRLETDAVWIVDPIDGTRSYLAGRDDWAVCVALATGGKPVLAAIFAPATEEFFFAAAGVGATRNGVPIFVTPGRDLDGAKLAGPKRVLERVAALHPQVVQLPRIGALALRIAYVAHGGVDVAVAGGNSHDWDLAAADLLVHEAGGLLTDLDGVRPVYNRPSPVHGSLIAAGRERHRTFLELARNLQLA
jgi:myo-inositol-1(or 4)-monophosphatase